MLTIAHVWSLGGQNECATVRRFLQVFMSIHTACMPRVRSQRGSHRGGHLVALVEVRPQQRSGETTGATKRYVGVIGLRSRPVGSRKTECRSLRQIECEARGTGYAVKGRFG